MVLVECKNQTRPVERDEVMVLESKIRDVNAQKGMLFSTSGFQSGAIEFASAKHIATVSIVEGKWLYETRAAGPARAEPPSMVSCRPICRHPGDEDAVRAVDGQHQCPRAVAQVRRAKGAARQR